MNEASDAMALVQQAEGEGIMAWSDDKKKEFVTTFQDRSVASQYILRQCAHEVLEVAWQKHFLSDKHVQDLRNEIQRLSYSVFASGRALGGRSRDSLNTVAHERAEQILKELPSLKEAVRVIDTVTAKNIEKKEVLVKKLKALKEQLEAIAGHIDLREIDQSMTIGNFLKMVKDREKQRKNLVESINELAREGVQIEGAINKALYKGLPGLSEAVIDVVRQHLEQATALDELTRRVSERVLFGDSKHALEMLKNFEKDEVAVSDDTRNKFKAALDKLHLAGKRKKLAGKKK